MSREPNIPLLLWISTAILAHIATCGGADQVARIFEERAELRSFAQSVRERLHPPTTIEIGFESDPAKVESTPPQAAPADPATPKPTDVEKQAEQTKPPPKKPEPPK